MIFIAKITHVKRISSAVSMGGRKLQNLASVDIWMTPLKNQNFEKKILMLERAKNIPRAKISCT